VPVFVVTHSVPDGWPREDAPFTFVTDGGAEGIASAITRAKAAAGEKQVVVGSANVAQQCLNAGLLDEIRVNLVPVLLGNGIRFFDKLSGAPVELEGPRVIEGTGVTHLYYRVQRG
jgi:dihydrofolate reductase